MKVKPVVVISSTAQDLDKYRVLVTDACLRADMFPKMMEQLPAMNEDAIHASLDMVDHADLYVGIFAHRYGYVPDGHEISITQMEYERAVERDIPRLIFLMDDDVPVLPKDFDTANADRLQALKQRLRKEHVVASFTSPRDLRGLVVDSLAKARAAMDAARTDAAGQPTPAALLNSIHHISDIPQPPEAYIAHPYTLLQVRRLVGRKEELELLTDWITGKRFDEVRIFNIVAIGGMGKSALTWTWFNEVAPQEMSPLAGRVWWSFYESDATFENFVTRVLAYVSHRPLLEVKKLSFGEREKRLLDALNREPFLIAFDGLERILIAYARLDAAYLPDDESVDEEAANRVAGALGLPLSAGQSFVGKHKLRMTADPRARRFFHKLSHVRASRILISTRLYPADLQAPMGDPLPGCFALFLRGLSDNDALELWRAFGAKGSRGEMLPVFRSFDKHPLLIQLLAREVADFRSAPGDFDAWRAGNPAFDPFGMPLVQVQSHVLAHALSGLSTEQLRTLYVIAGFRMPASMDTLKSLLIDPEQQTSQRPFATLRDLDAALTALEDRGVLGWDRSANRYDLHPIVRGVVWTGLDERTRTDLYGTLRTHFEAMPLIDHRKVETLDDLAPAIELFNTLIGLKLYDEAYELFLDRLGDATLYSLSTNRLRIALLGAIFPDGPEAPPQLSQAEKRASAIHEMAVSYLYSGQIDYALPLFRLACEQQPPNRIYLSMLNMGVALYRSGKLQQGEKLIRETFNIARERFDYVVEGISICRISHLLATRGLDGEANRLLRVAQQVFKSIRAYDIYRFSNLVPALECQTALWCGDNTGAKAAADEAVLVTAIQPYEHDVIRAVRLQGTAALHIGDFPAASKHLNKALPRARAVSLIEEELPTLIALSELHRQQGEPDQARAMLDDLWDLAERGPYPLFNADALNVLAQIERDAGNREAAVEAATKAYRLAWCDGPPFAYHWGLEKAKAHLAALGAAEPDMPPFDESQHEPMPEVEINPPDEFGGDVEPDDDGVAE